MILCTKGLYVQFVHIFLRMMTRELYCLLCRATEAEFLDVFGTKVLRDPRNLKEIVRS
jgi:hypothetical protein